MSEQDINLDTSRHNRIRLEEAIFCAGKTTTQIDTALARLDADNRGALLTRLDADHFAMLATEYQTRMDYDELSQTAYFNWRAPADMPTRVALVTAGTSDIPAAREAGRTLRYAGVESFSVFDVGVAGLWRLLDRIDEIRRFPIAIVAAGMDAALPSVLGGLYGGLVVAVPTSVGYGVAAGGHTALNAVLASCASGIVVVNIDNGYGAACAALRVLNGSENTVAAGAAGR